ncbi:hypothetical protein EW146_g1804 [Bondarzewia mesenterica]|uniref:P-loop containing nucleoside triphosphate hydrolase protein n=1 Tax=Bondarzewia mesenterica TaxID=1095465 RepID=A0A4V3XFY4_9AGAM|nr:hypothetical protein EW146_g1804 [Bondarzewia mesenterica]
MRRPPALEVDTEAAMSTVTPDFSTKFTRTPEFSPESSSQALNLSHSPEKDYIAPNPSFRLLFSLLSRRDFFLLVLPAIISSVIAGGIAPFMTYVVGQVFNTFAQFPLTSDPPQEAKDALLRGVGLSAIELIGLAVGALALSSLTSSLWIWTGERNTMLLRKKVYQSVTSKDMIWFDTKMGAEDSVQSSEGDGPVGAGGLMAKFARETEEVRMASSLACGMVIQHLTTSVACLILGFDRSWALTLVILSAVPVLMIIQAFSQGVAGPLLAVERSQTATAATLMDRAVAAIATVKAFNAVSHEVSTLSIVLDNMRAVAKKCNAVWGFTSGLAQFVMMAMFVQGFWFGSKLVRDGKVAAGDVMAVFWACLIATTNLQMCIPQFITLAKGKFSMAALISLIEVSTPVPESPVNTRRPSLASFNLSTGKNRKPSTFRKIVPRGCSGELVMDNVTFAYPSRPTVPVLTDLSLYLPAHEITFIVGGSGSGKSTVAQLLLRMYDVQQGTIALDNQDVDYLDLNWTREQISAISQDCILFDMSVHDNVAIGLAGPGSNRRPEDVTREEVIEACTAALMHDFVRNLPDGYDTPLGNGGANLSGGQKQRLAIARAKLRDSNVLILDEATSALDAISRLLVFEAIKRWRRNKTTVVITHDLSQITPGDFVYVLKDGHVVEQGYRHDLEQIEGGEFREMAQAQGAAGGFPEKQAGPWSEKTKREREEEVEKIFEEQEKVRGEDVEKAVGEIATFKRQTVIPPSLRPLTLGNWMFDAVADLTRSEVIPHAMVVTRSDRRVSRFVPADVFNSEPEIVDRPRRPSTIAIDLPEPAPAHTTMTRRLSLQFTPTSPIFSSNAFSTSSTLFDEVAFDEEKANLELSAAAASQRRFYGDTIPRRTRARWDDIDMIPLKEVKISQPEAEVPHARDTEEQIGFWHLVRDIYPTVPCKPTIALGLIFCIVSGAMTPIFSFLLSRLLYEVSIGAQNVSAINNFGGIVLSVAAIDGIAMGLKYFTMETTAMAWVTKIRKMCYGFVLAQDKKWFDKAENAPVRLVQVLIKDGDDARSLIATVLSQAVVVFTMLGVGLMWALARGWQLTLVGFAIAPVFAITMVVQTNLVAKCEYRNKRAREEVARGYYDTISNIRGIRSMGFERIFLERFEESVDSALSTGVRGAFVEGCTYGVASSLIYLAEALLFYVGAILIAKGTYNYLQMVQVLNLVVFTVSIGSQLMAFTQRIAKSVQATKDFNKLLRLSTDTDESQGSSRPPITGTISFNGVRFSYPERSDVTVLDDLNMEIHDGECVAIVGASGSGKSTIAALLQRLYEPVTGSISIGPWDLDSTDVSHLRDHVAVVSQHPNLFDATVSDNIAYGSKGLPAINIQRAAMAANVHDFVMSLPQGYDTMVGENAALISGGQAQRLQIARALVRPSKILILDECTSALDSANQATVMQTILDAKVGRTTLMVTHKLPVMQMCDRILVIHKGSVAEQGTYEELMAKNGVFAQLASGGEWTGE